ncbi:MAG TPA: hypothetical protein VHH34_23325 [Pseudonocardiaceae bacterium]|nr:hypothetical protein [Pseudonocardiaceae bacterium]
MKPASLAVLVVLILDAVLLAAVELLYLPLRVGVVPLPLTILLAAVSTPWLVRNAAALGGPAWTAAAPLVVWVVALLVFGVAGPGGDVLLPAYWRSLLLMAAGIFPGAVALGRVLAKGLAP